MTNRLSTVAVLAVLAAVWSGPASAACEAAPNACPMYGGIEKTAAMKETDRALVAEVEETGMTRREGAVEFVDKGWDRFYDGDPDTAMKRFNQAWLLDAELGDVYHGMAVVTAARDRDAPRAEALFQRAMDAELESKTVYADYGYFLMRTGRTTQAETFLIEKLDAHPDVRNLRYNLAIALLLQDKRVEACKAGKAALQAGDDVQTDFLDDACGKAAE